MLYILYTVVSSVLIGNFSHAPIVLNIPRAFTKRTAVPPRVFIKMYLELMLFSDHQRSAVTSTIGTQTKLQIRVGV